MLEKFGANVLNLFICFLFLYFYFSIGFSFTSLSFFTQCNEYYKSMYDHVIFSHVDFSKNLILLRGIYRS